MMTFATPLLTIIFEQRKQGEIRVVSSVSTSNPSKVVPGEFSCLKKRVHLCVGTPAPLVVGARRML